MSEHIGKRVAQEREKLGISMRELGRRVGRSSGYISQLEGGLVAQPRHPLLVKLARALDVRKEWLLTGEGPLRDDEPLEFRLSTEERTVVTSWREVPTDARPHISALIEYLATSNSGQVVPIRKDVVEIDHRGAMRTIRVVGDVAALSPDAEVVYDSEPDGGETCEVPEAWYQEGCVAVKVHGSSMVGEGILDGDCLLVLPATYGQYRKKDTVIAWTAQHGMLIKVYAGQRKGIIKLRSANPDVPDIEGKTREEIEIRAKVLKVYREH